MSSPESVWVVPFSAITRNDLAKVGGKGANLGELTRAGFPVPAGFCVSTDAFRAFLDCGDVSPLFDRLARLNPEDTESLRLAGEATRAILGQLPVPAPVAHAVAHAWRQTGVDRFYAVRSSATAEDLPTASFAGQQDTYLNVRGWGALIERIRDCWVSLFTDRAIAYRARNGFDHRRVLLCVIVQRMVMPEVSGILFTADPVDGRRHIVSIDAGFGLGDALVSGLTSADLYKIDKRTRAIVQKSIARKTLAIVPLPEGGTRREALGGERATQASLSDAQALALADMGARIEAHYGSPQDIEWCIEDGRIDVVQSRPITTLYPLPDGADPNGPLAVYLSFGHVQVMTEALPPFARSIWRHVFPFGRDHSGVSQTMVTAGGRLYINVSWLMRTAPFGEVLPKAMRVADRLVADGVADVVGRPAFGYGSGARLEVVRAVLPVLGPVFARVVLRLLVSNPEGSTSRGLAFIDETVEAARERLNGARAGAERFAAAIGEAEMIFFTFFPRLIPYLLSGGLSQAALGRLLRGRGVDADVTAFAQGLEGNVTTEMDLAVGDLADVAKANPAVAAHLKSTPAKDVLRTVGAVDGGDAFVRAMDAFLERYGMRGAFEIDITRPRWRDDPTPLVQIILGNLALETRGAHRAHHQQMKRQGLEASERLIAAATPVQRPLVRRLIRVARNNLALREHPKYLLIRLLDLVREAAHDCAGLLLQQGRIEARDDVYFLTAEELLEALRTTSMPLEDLVRSRRAEHEGFRKLSPPRVLTNEGESVTGSHAREHLPPGALAGTAASPGIVEGRAHVVLDPHHAILEAGEILVAPFTDPGWTPLFINAKGLVMEVGGLMTHGSVVAREYGIPAVVCVPDATRLIRTGQRIRVNGDEGLVEVLSR
jgi:pyruvate,water dikinase